MSGPDGERVEEKPGEETAEPVEERGEEAAEDGDCGCRKGEPARGDPRVKGPVPNVGRRPV